MDAWCLRWPDGRTIGAPTARELIERIGRDSFDGEPDLVAVRAGLARRAQAWSGAEVDPSLPAEAFVRALARAKLFALPVSPPRHAAPE